MYDPIIISPDTKGLIFDCDGTLADTMPLHMEAWCETFVDYGEECPYEFVNSLKGTSAEKIVAMFNQKFGRKINPIEFAHDKNRRSRQKLRQAKPIGPVIKIVRNYRGKLPMAVVSGGTRRNVLLTLEVIGLKDYFVTVITSDDKFKSKPAPDIFLEAARRMKVEPPHCQVFEDGDVGLQAARVAGMITTDIRKYIKPSSEFKASS
jgi:HAD superfamily hydrolase (TIGR01509 family)